MGSEMRDVKLPPVLLGVNGGLMRGFPANQRMVDAGARFEREALTSPDYRLFSIENRFPGMLRDSAEGRAIALEIWRLSPEGFVAVVEAEPLGLSVGRVELDDGARILGVLAEPWLCESRLEITGHGGWREYLRSVGLPAGDER